MVARCRRHPSQPRSLLSSTKFSPGRGGDLEAALGERHHGLRSHPLGAGLDAARADVAALVNALPQDLVFLPNVTAAVNVVVRSLFLSEGDQLLTTSHVYNSCRNVLDFAAHQTGAEVVEAKVPFPISDPVEAVSTIIEAVTNRTAFALIDHMTSITGLKLPIEELVAELEARGIAVMINGAHGPGMVPIDLEALGASYYAGNHHKWLSAPKGRNGQRVFSAFRPPPTTTRTTTTASSKR